MKARVQAFMACSLDGFIAGPKGEIDWLNPSEGAEDTFTPFMASVGAMLMGRNTYDVVAGLGVPWPYGDTPVFVATTRPLVPCADTVTAVSGSIGKMVEQAQQVASPGHVYLDGGALVQSALDAGLVDDITATMIPIILGAGIPLFAGVSKRTGLDLTSTRGLGAGLVELRYTIAEKPTCVD